MPTRDRPTFEPILFTRLQPAAYNIARLNKPQKLTTHSLNSLITKFMAILVFI